MEDIKIALNQLLNVKKSIYSDSFWCFKDILEGIIEINVEDEFTETIEEVDIYSLKVFKSLNDLNDDVDIDIDAFLMYGYSVTEEVKSYLEEFTKQLKISKRIFNLFLDKLEVIIENSNGNYSKSDEEVLTIMLELAEKITKYCYEDGESAKELLEDITTFNKKYEEI